MSKERSVYFCEVTTENGSTFSNPLLPNELYLVGTLARENSSVTVTHRKVDQREFEVHFGKNYF